MVQILGFFSNGWDYISFNIINGLFIMVAKVYDYLQQLIDLDPFDLDKFTDLATILYVLAGVFMLFRVIVSMIQMLINPDQMMDKQAGAGKLITRVVISIVMLMLFVPNGIIFGETGIFQRVEEALLYNEDEKDPGLVIRIMEMGLKEDNSTEKNSKKKTDNLSSANSNALVENVYADNKTLTCYYYAESSYIKYLNQKDKDNITSNELYKITFSLSKKKNYVQLDGSPVYYYVSNARVQGGAHGDDFKYLSLPNNKKLTDSDGMFSKIDIGNGVTSVLPSSCPQKIDFTTGDTEPLRLKKDEHTTGSVGLSGGYASISKMIEQFKQEHEKAEKSKSSESPDYAYVKKLKYEGSLQLAQASAASLQECAADKESECIEIQQEMFKSPSGNAKVTEAMKEDILDINFIFSVILGIGLIVYLMFLCIEILIRRLKLFFLEIISPLPAICYVDPKDKIFNSWSKMYISTYLDLFIKLIAIGIATTLLGEVAKDFWGNEGFFLKFFEIVAILTFAKILPTMISKIFGLDSMGSSFKDITGLAKGAAMAGVGGAALLGAHALATGGNMTAAYKYAKSNGKNAGGAALKALGAGALGVPGALVRGIGAGVKGNVRGGVDAMSAKNARTNEAKKNGLNFWDRTVASMAGIMGYSPKTRMDNQIKDIVDKKQMLDDFRKHKDNIENMADSSNYLSDIKSKIATNPDSFEYYDDDGNRLTGKQAFKEARSDFIKLNETNRKNSNGNIEYYDANSNSWIDSGQGDYYITANGTQSNVLYEKASKGKIEQAENEMRAAFNANHDLQKELGMEGQNIANFKAYADAEGKAKDKSNAYSTQIISVQQSDKYGKAKAKEEFTKSQK